ncbi:hypothetical protein C6P45_001281 [Maudiozyma exigua]|uniref:HTH APSES-type domain-containing protein n=1 Tax=Maudiozyma exigua TaxID=34358 RepID=A0A9P6W138_MAUEX|nr:hypothetical protein C6P45_001281 [Kazachstania exigua]
MSKNVKANSKIKNKDKKTRSNNSTTCTSKEDMLADKIHIKNFRWDPKENVEFPVSYLSPSIVKLTNSPLDDYQRSFFSYALLDDKELDLNIEYTTYRTSIAEQFISPIYQTKQKRSRRNGRHSGGHRRSKHLLECFEYQLPNLRQSFTEEDRIISPENGTPSPESLIEIYRKNLCLDRPNVYVLDGIIISSIEEESKSSSAGSETNSDDKDTASNSTETSDDKPLQNSASRDTNLENIVESEIPLLRDNKSDSISYSLTKNQKFRLQKIDHNSEKNQKIINPNNCIIWTFEGGYVFLTGIWRLYQDVMKGLITIPRKNCHDNKILQELCAVEFKSVLSHTVFNITINSDGKVRHSKKRNYPESLGTNSQIDGLETELKNNTADTTFDVLEEFNKLFSQSKSKYTDLHWNSLPSTLRHELFESFKVHLIKEKNVPANFFNGFDMTQLIHRIRGGYIKIQGTWIPMEIAKSLCIKFCFPIRYFLVPIFGPDFPDQCANWFLENQDGDVNVVNSGTSQDIPYSPISKKRLRSLPKLLQTSLTDGDHLLHQQYPYRYEKQENSPHIRMNDQDLNQHTYTQYLNITEGKYMQQPVAYSQNIKQYSDRNNIDNEQKKRDVQNRPHLPHITNLINSLNGSPTPRENLPSREGFPQGQQLQNTPNIEPSTNVSTNQTPHENMTRAISQPVYAMSGHFDNAPSPVYHHPIQYGGPPVYESYSKENVNNQYSGHIVSVPAASYQQVGPVVGHDPNIYVRNQMVPQQVRQVPTPGQVVYINKTPQIIHQQVMPTTMHQPNQIPIHQLGPHYAVLEDGNRVPVNPNSQVVMVQPQMQPQILPQYTNNPVIIAPANNNNNINTDVINSTGSYVRHGQIGEEEQYYQIGQYPPNDSQNPFWKDGRYQ